MAVQLEKGLERQAQIAFLSGQCGIGTKCGGHVEENYFPGGFVKQEQIALSDMVHNRFGRYYRHSKENQYA